MDQSEHYYQLALLGRDRFLAAAAPSLVRKKGSTPSRQNDEDADTTLVASLDGALGSTAGPSSNLDVFPLLKKPGAPFADMITVGRTANNDVVLNHITVSRFHAYFRHKGDGWTLSDAGSKNGSFLESERLEARKERAIESGDRLRMGDVEVTFFAVSDLFDMLSGSR